METSFAPLLANIYMAMLEEELYIISNIYMTMFKSLIDHGFRIIKSNKKQFSMWVNEFNNLREFFWVDEFNNLQDNMFVHKWHFGNNVAYIDLFIFQAEILM